MTFKESDSGILVKDPRIVKDSSKLSFSFPVNVTKAREEDGDWYVDFIASDTDIDLHNERFTERAIKDMVKYAKEGVDIIKTHYEPFAMGKTVDGEILSEGKDEISGIDIYKFKGTAKLDKRYPESEDLFKDVRDGINKRQLSVGGFIDWDKPDAVLWEEIEIAVTENTTTTLYVLALNVFELEHIAITRHKGAANPRSGFLSAIMRSIDHEWMVKHNISPSYKSIDEAVKAGSISKQYNLGWLDLSHSNTQDHIMKSANGYKEFPLAKEETSWSFSTSDANSVLGDNKDDWKNYKRVHFWFDPDNQEKKSGYKLPFAKKIDGTISAVWRGVSAAMAALLGARGGVDIPDDQRKAIYGKIKAYYKRFDKEPPEFKTYTFEDFVALDAHKGIEDFLLKYKFYFIREDDSMADTNLKEQIQEKAKKESQERMKSLPGKHIVSEEVQEEVVKEVDETPTDEVTKSVDDTETKSEVVEKNDVNAGENLINLFGQLNDTIDNAIKSLDLGTDSETETEVEEVQKTEETVEEPETEVVKEKAPETEVTKTEVKPDNSELIGTLKSIQSALKGITELSNNQIKSMSEKNTGLVKQINDLASRVSNCELDSANKSTPTRVMDSSTEIVKSVDNGDLTDLLFGPAA